MAQAETQPTSTGSQTTLPTPPGSTGLPFIGEALSYARNPHLFVESRRARYGEVFKTRILRDRVVCFTGPEAFTFFIDNPAFERAGAAVDENLPVESDGQPHPEQPSGQGRVRCA